MDSRARNRRLPFITRFRLSRCRVLMLLLRISRDIRQRVPVSISADRAGPT